MTAKHRIERLSVRRSRIALGLCGLLAIAILVTGLPVSALLAQHRQVAEASAQLSQLHQVNQQLASEARQLSNPSVVQGLARSEYGLVPPGQKAYVILPPAGSSASTVTGSGHIPLNGPPVAPGSAQSRQLLGMGIGALAGLGGSGPMSTGAATSSQVSAGSVSGSTATAHAVAQTFWGRVLQALEFWR